MDDRVCTAFWDVTGQLSHLLTAEICRDLLVVPVTFCRLLTSKGLERASYGSGTSCGFDRTVMEA
jgi:hypothetical protein